MSTPKDCDAMRAGLRKGARYTVTARRAINRPASTFVGVYVKPRLGGARQVFTSDASGMDVEVCTDLLVSATEVAK